MPPRPRRSSPLSLLALLSAASVHLRRAAARTVYFDDANALVRYAPASAWDQVSALGLFGGAAQETNGGGATVELAFAGEQLSLFGVATTAFTVSIDGATATNTPNTSSSSGKNVSTRFFLTSNLSRSGSHRLFLRTTGAGTVRLDRIGVAYSDESGLVPRLVAVGSSSSTSVAARDSSPASTSSAATATASPSAVTEGGPRPGAVAGAVIGALLSVALLVFLIFLVFRRRKSRSAHEHDRLSYFNADTGRRKSTTNSFVAALGGGGSTPRISPIPFSSPGLAPPSRRSSPANAADGGVGRSPHPYAPHSSAHLAVPRGDGSASPAAPPSPLQTWTQRLARASSWRRKASRLPETQRFYGVSPAGARSGGAGLPPDPPPARPLPSVPPREMQERWREEPQLVQGSGRWASPRESEETTPSVAAPARYEGPVEASPATHPIAATHLRRRSIPRPAPSSPSSLPRPPPAAAATAAPLSPRSFRNPFGSTSTAGLDAFPPSHPSPHHAQADSYGSLSTFHTRGTSSSDARAASLEGAHIVHARPVVAPLAGAGADAGAGMHTDDVPLYGPGTHAVPTRVRSMRDVKDMYRAEGASKPPGLARRPTLTLREGGAGAGAEGYETERERETEQAQRARHRSAAALIEVVEELGLDELVGGGTRDPPPGEEDRPAYFQQRERMPRYSVERGDPRAGMHSATGSR